HKKYGDMFEINLAGQRLIILGKADLIENMLTPSTKNKYPLRLKITEGIVEYGINGSNTNDLKAWRYNRQFFTQAMLNSSLNHQAIEWVIESWEQMESYWNNLGENRELDLTKWIRRFTNDIIFRIATGVKNDSVSSYYNSLMLENCNSINE